MKIKKIKNERQVHKQAIKSKYFSVFVTNLGAKNQASQPQLIIYMTRSKQVGKGQLNYPIAAQKTSCFHRLKIAFIIGEDTVKTAKLTRQNGVYKKR